MCLKAGSRQVDDPADASDDDDEATAEAVDEPASSSEVPPPSSSSAADAVSSLGQQASEELPTKLNSPTHSESTDPIISPTLRPSSPSVSASPQHDRCAPRPPLETLVTHDANGDDNHLDVLSRMAAHAIQRAA